jgi:hypothetical protein
VDGAAVLEVVPAVLVEPSLVVEAAVVVTAVVDAPVVVVAAVVPLSSVTSTTTKSAMTATRTPARTGMRSEGRGRVVMENLPNGEGTGPIAARVDRSTCRR